MVPKRIRKKSVVVSGECYTKIMPLTSPLFQWDFKALTHCIKESRNYVTLWLATDNLDIYIFTGVSKHLCLLYFPKCNPREGRRVPYPAALFYAQRDVEKKKRKEGGSIRTTLVPILLPTKSVVFPIFLEPFSQPFAFNSLTSACHPNESSPITLQCVYQAKRCLN